MRYLYYAHLLLPSNLRTYINRSIKEEQKEIGRWRGSYSSINLNAGRAVPVGEALVLAGCHFPRLQLVDWETNISHGIQIVVCHWRVFDGQFDMFLSRTDNKRIIYQNIFAFQSIKWLYCEKWLQLLVIVHQHAGPFGYISDTPLGFHEISKWIFMTPQVKRTWVHFTVAWECKSWQHFYD